MKSVDQSNIRLKSFSCREERDGQLEVDISNVIFEGFDLFIGDNAQGKTRLFRTLKFVADLLRGSRKRILTHFTGKFSFDVQINEHATAVGYEIKITPTSEGENDYSETITKGDNILFSTDNKILVNEENNQNIDNFFIPPNIPSVAAIGDPRFTTIRLIREFFQRMLFIGPTRGPYMEIERSPVNALILDPDGANLAGVLSYWNKEKQPIYQELINDLKRCFPIIEQVKLVPQVLSPGVKTEFLAFHEKEITKDILQVNWSEGIWRTLCLLCLPKTEFEFGDKIYPPSMIFIDEIENGLDFKTLKFITSYLKDYSDQTQIVMSSHSPIMSEFVHPKNWQIVKRRGSKIKISKPILIEKNLDEQLSFFRGKYWDFYTKHISSSDLYEPN